MIALSLPFQNRVRLSCDGRMCARGKSPKTCRAKVLADGTAELVNKELTVEWLSPRGGHFLYGLLGATAEPLPGRNVELDVVVGEYDGRHPTSLASGLGQVHFGLPAEYASVVIASAESVLEKAFRLPASRISFDEAAYSDVGSSGMVFERLTEVVIALLSQKHNFADESQSLRETVAGILLR